MTAARSIRVRGVVQGVGFRPFVFRLARANGLAGWVSNEPDGVDIHLEGAESALDALSVKAAITGALPCASPRIFPSARIASPNCSIRETTATGIHTSIAPTADRATR